MGLWDKIKAGAQAIGSKVLGITKAVVNNPIVAKVASIAAPGIYNAVKMGVGMADKAAGMLGLSTSGTIAPVSVAPAAAVIAPYKAPAVVTVQSPAIPSPPTAAPVPVEAVKRDSAASVVVSEKNKANREEFAKNTRVIENAFTKK